MQWTRGPGGTWKTCFLPDNPLRHYVTRTLYTHTWTEKRDRRVHRVIRHNESDTRIIHSFFPDTNAGERHKCACLPAYIQRWESTKIYNRRVAWLLAVIDVGKMRARASVHCFAGAEGESSRCGLENRSPLYTKLGYVGLCHPRATGAIPRSYPDAKAAGLKIMARFPRRVDVYRAPPNLSPSRCCLLVRARSAAWRLARARARVCNVFCA